MNINTINSLLSTGTNTTAASKTSATSQFADALNKALEQIDSTQQTSDVQTEALLAGNIDDLHNVTIAATEAELTLSLAVQVRNKVVDAYNEIMRMQV